MGANDLLRDLLISHQVDLQQLAQGTVQKLLALLARADADLTAQLLVALDRGLSDSTVERLDALLASVRAISSAGYAQLGGELRSVLQDLAVYEAGFQAQALASVLPPAIEVQRVMPEQALAAALSRPFQGRLLSEWLVSLESQQAIRLRDAVRIAFVENETTEQLVRRLRGTRAERWQDGLLQIDRRAAEGVARTALSHVAGSVRDAVMAANEDIISAVAWSATLDLRTSDGCAIRDGKRYHPISHKPIGHAVPWKGGPGRLHWRCRSSSYPVLTDWRGMGLEDADADTRASLDGQVPADLSFGDWLQKQSAARQDEVVGPTRGRLMREGGLPFDRLYTNRGEMLTLDELRERDAQAFRRASL